MTLFEMLRKDPFYHLGFTQGLSGVPVVDCSEVAEWYCCHTTQEEWTMNDFPTLAPPWPRVWLDFKAPSYILMKDGRTITWEANQPDYWGVDCRWRDATIPNLIDSCRKSASIWNGTVKVQEEWINTMQPRWFMDSVLYWRRARQNRGPIWLQRIYIDKDGECMRDAVGGTLSIEGPLIEDLIKIQYEYMKVMKASLEDAQQYLYGQFASFFHNAYLSISFLHCKNILIKEIAPPKPKPMTNAQRRRGDLQVKQITYKVLEIAPMKKILQKTSYEQNTSGGRTLHFVRGHFHTYTAESPLFGKPGLTGSYFIPLHVKGNIENGITIKDYKIKKD